MSELNCAVARDLLPLYAEELLSDETAALVRAHLDSCADCRAALARAQTDLTLRPEKPEAPMKKVRRYAVALRIWYLFCPLAAFLLVYFGQAAWLSRYLVLLGVFCAVCIGSQYLSGATMGGVDWEQVRLQQTSETRSRKHWGGYYASPLQICLPALITAGAVAAVSIWRVFSPVMTPALALIPVALVGVIAAIHLIDKRLPK